MNRLRNICRRPIRFRGVGRPGGRGASTRGFTLLELIIVTTMIGILAAIALPNMIQTPRRAKESVLKTNLRTLRQVIDQHYGDKGQYPATLEVLEEDGYLRSVPIDPMTGEAEWGLEYEEPSDEFLDEPIDDGWGDFEEDLEESAGIIDVYSLSEGIALDGTEYSEW